MSRRSKAFNNRVRRFPTLSIERVSPNRTTYVYDGAGRATAWRYRLQVTEYQRHRLGCFLLWGHYVCRVVRGRSQRDFSASRETPEDLAAKIERLLEEPGLRDCLGLAGRAIAH